jgi:hypothetical protein
MRDSERPVWSSVEAVEVTDELEDVLDRIEQQDEQVPTLPRGTTARQFLGMVMRGEIDPQPKQINAAKVLIEFEEAKLTAVAMGHFDGKDFASQLERAILRSQSPYVPRALPASEQHPASELKGNFPVRRRNLR